MPKAALPNAEPASTPVLAPHEELDLIEGLAGLGHGVVYRGRLILISAGLRTMMPLGATPTPRSLLRRLAPVHRRAVLRATRLAIRSGQISAVDVTCNCDPEPNRTLRLTLKPLDASQIWFLCEDVTLQARVVEKLSDTERRWETALESARQGVWDINLKTGEIYHSRTWRLLRGLNPDGDPRDTHDHWKSRVHPDDLASVMRFNSTEQSGRTHTVSVYRERHADGHWVWIQSVGASFETDQNGKPIRIIGTDTDITPAKEREGQLLALSRRLELALNAFEIGVFDLNLDTSEIVWDDRCRQIYGLPLDHKVARGDWIQYVHPDDRVRAKLDANQAVLHEGDYSSDFRIVRPDGQIRYIRTSGMFCYGPDGERRLIGANWDITEAELAKQELENAKTLAEARNRLLEQAKAQIEHSALHDMLTGLPNRRYLEDVLTRRASRSGGPGSGVALLHLDLDRFKQINDTLGHAAGDAMLIHTAQLLKGNLRDSDFVARVGGDEFVIVTDYDGDSSRLSRLAGRLIEEMRKPVLYKRHYCRFGASIGIATQPSDGIDPERLQMDADIALYLAKARGKNGFQFFSESLQAQTLMNKTLTDELLAAIELDQFVPYYQPIVEAKTMSLAGVEALGRWQHPRRGLLAPAQFLKTAEDLNLVTEIDKIILDKALTDFERWHEMRLGVPAVAVNVSFRRLADEQLISSLDVSRIRPGTLSFELLESIFLDDFDDRIRHNLDYLRDIGVEIAVDDFGTGHASIIGLLKLRPNRLKIDRQFIEELESSAGQQRLVGSLIDMGKSLGIKVVAEGVETLAQAEILRRLGCDMLQGYAFSGPLSAAGLERRVRDRSWGRAV